MIKVAARSENTARQRLTSSKAAEFITQNGQVGERYFDDGFSSLTIPRQLYKRSPFTFFAFLPDLELPSIPSS